MRKHMELCLWSTRLEVGRGKWGNDRARISLHQLMVTVGLKDSVAGLWDEARDRNTATGCLGRAVWGRAGSESEGSDDVLKAVLGFADRVCGICSCANFLFVLLFLHHYQTTTSSSFGRFQIA